MLGGTVRSTDPGAQSGRWMSWVELRWCQIHHIRWCLHSVELEKKRKCIPRAKKCRARGEVMAGRWQSVGKGPDEKGVSWVWRSREVLYAWRIIKAEREEKKAISVAREEGREPARRHKTDALYAIFRNLEFTLHASRKDKKIWMGPF